MAKDMMYQAMKDIANIYLHQEKYDLAEAQKLRLTASNAANFGSNYYRDDMDCIIDYVAAKKEVWNGRPKGLVTAS